MNYESCLNKITDSNERVMVLTAENRAFIRNLPHQIKERFVDFGIAEQTMIGAACGLALRGKIPVCHALAAFLTMRSFEFIRTDVGIANLPVKLVGCFAGFLSEANGPTHQAIEDISLINSIPGICIFAPSDEEDMLIGLEQVINSPKPFYIRYNHLKPAVNHDSNFRIGKAEIINWGNDITIFTYGTLLRQAYEAMIILENKGISVRLINMRCLKPIDEGIIINSALETNLIVTIEDHFLCGGLYSIICEILVRNLINSHVLPFGIKDKWFKPCLLNDILTYEKFTGSDISQKILLYYNNYIEDIKIKSLI
jgi:transketolase